MLREALRDRGLLGQAASGLVAQLTQAAAGLGIILVVQAAGGSLALAGAAAAVFVIGAGGARPVQGYLIDRHGPRPVLLWSALLHVLAAAALVGFVEIEGPEWPLLLFALPLGLGEPPVSQSMRVAWAELAREGNRTAAYSLVTLIQELAVLLGPLLLAAIVAVWTASAALFAVSALSALGTFALALALPSSPGPSPAPRGQLPLRSAGVRDVLAVTALFGVSLGAVELAIPALTEERDQPALSGLLLALMSVGGVAGAVAYGSRQWRTGTATHLVVLLGLLAAGLALLVPSPSYLLMAVPLLIAGAAINPVVTAGALLIEDHAPSAAAEVFGWQSTALAAGAAAGSAAAGIVAEGDGASAAFAVSAGAAAAAFGVAALTRRRLGSLAGTAGGLDLERAPTHSLMMHSLKRSYEMSRTPQHKIGSGFGHDSTTADVLRGIDLAGKLAIVTGGYSGIGLATTRALAGAGANVVVPARRRATAEEALTDIDGVEIDELDLADLESVRRFAERFLASERGLDIVIDSAGIMATPETRVGPGWEAQFATNHLGHYALVNRLWPAIAPGGARVVAVSSAGHRRSGIRWDDVNFERGYDKWQSYGQAKTANVLFAVQLDALGRDAGVRAFAVHPGGILTPLQRHLEKEEMVAAGWIDEDGNPGNYPFKTPEQGAATQVWAATSPQLEGMGGVYCEDCDIAELAPSEGEFTGGVREYAVDPEQAARLWALSAELTGVDAFAAAAA